MMKRLTALLLTLLVALPCAALGEKETVETILAPYVITAPEGVTAEVGVSGSSVTYVNGMVRVVAQTLHRVPDPDGDHAAELEKLMQQYAPAATELTLLGLSEGFYGLVAIVPDSLNGVGGRQIPMVTVMVLWQSAMEGELLILSGFDMAGSAGDTDAAMAMVTEVLKGTELNGRPVMVRPAAAPAATDAPAQE